MTWSIPVPLSEDVTMLSPADLGRSTQGLRVRPTVHLPWIGVDRPTPDRQRLADLSAANQAKDECLAMVAHELRNALSPMSTAAEVLNTPGVSVSTSEQARGIITRQLENMTRLVNDLLDGARITQGTMALHLAPTDLSALLQRAVEDVAAQVALRDQEVIVSVSAEPCFVLGDPVRLAQAFGNLLNNASKFTRRGGRIWLSAELCQVTAAASEAVVHIRDEGIGVTSEMLPRVFDLFKQAGHSPHHAQGLGVGLALVRRIVELHRGRVNLLSAGVDKGSEFIVSLPLLQHPALTA